MTGDARQAAGFDGRVAVEVDGYRGPVRVRVDGEDAAGTVVLVHGFSGSLFWWGAVAERLAATHRVIRTDLLGHGETGGPAADAPLQARVLARVLAALGVVAPVTVVGHSFGADVAVELADRDPRISRVAIICQAPDYSDARLPFGKELMAATGRATAIHRVATVAARGVAAVRSRWVDEPRRDLIQHALRDFTSLNPAMFPVVLVARRDRMATRPLDVQLRSSGRPALVVLGARDHFYGARSAARYRAAGASVTVLPAAGHSPVIDDPDRIAQLLDDFCGADATD